MCQLMPTATQIQGLPILILAVVNKQLLDVKFQIVEAEAQWLEHHFAAITTISIP